MCVLILIILEYIYILFYKKIRMQFWSLNPYYTGIHLHRRITSPDALSLVLILIILEYIYINYNVTLAASVSVLILIILEYIYMKPDILFWKLSFVLILIILEYIYIHDLCRGRKERRNVLILIILEYIYMFQFASLLQ